MLGGKGPLDADGADAPIDVVEAALAEALIKAAAVAQWTTVEVG